MHIENARDQNLPKRVLQQIPAPIMAVDADLTVLYVNDDVCVDRELHRGIVGRKCYDVLGNPHCRTSDCGMQRALQDRETTRQRTEIDIRGESRPIEHTCAPILDEEGNLVGGDTPSAVPVSL
jgi:rsbT co-antagonist protein RsbR